MTKKRRKRRTDKVGLPERGSTFLMPLQDGRYGLCRVIRCSSPEEEQFMGAQNVLVVASSWIGNHPPELSDPQVLPVLQCCIERLNQADREYGHFICTIEREDLCDCFDELVYVSGLREHENLADQWREW